MKDIQQQSDENYYSHCKRVNQQDFRELQKQPAKSIPKTG